jgi:DNA polymerase-3 subunit alpha
MCFDMHQTDKLAIFMDDMRRLEVVCHSPDVNQSEAEFTVETNAHGEHAVRYALGGIKNVGERAMETLVTERTTAGLFKSLDDFANRVDPSQINRRSLENLAAAGAFDALEPNRGAVHAAAETLLAASQSARDSRESGQGGLFGEGGSDMAALRIDNSMHWAPGEQMNQEKEAFGFYFSAHPCSQYDALASSHGAKPYAVWLDSGPIPEGVRRAATMSALIEGVRWRESRKGRRFMIADFSDISGQFSVRCFDETIGMQLAEWAKDAECLLLHCEMDMRPGDETPSFTVKSAKPLSGLTSVSRLKIKLDVTHEAALSRLAEMVAPLHGGRSELVIKTRADDGRFVHIVLGRRFQIDASLLDQVRTIDGIENVELAPLGPVLALVH